jgi:hypothetical protein
VVSRKSRNALGVPHFVALSSSFPTYLSKQTLTFPPSLFRNPKILSIQRAWIDPGHEGDPRFVCVKITSKMAASAQRYSSLPADVLQLICEQLGDRQDFGTLFSKYKRRLYVENVQCIRTLFQNSQNYR